MSKYEGIEIPQTHLSEAQNIKKPKKTAKKRGYWFSLFIRLTIAGVLLGAVFGIAQIDTPATNAITDTIRNAINASFSQGGYVSSRDDFLFDSIANLWR